MTWTPLDVRRGAIGLPFLSLLAVLLFFGCLALLLSMVLPSRRLAAMTSGLTLAVNFFLTTLARLDTDLEPVERLLPLHYYQSGDAIRGLDYGSFFGLLAAAGLFAGLAWWLFECRDLRVGGEGVWQWPRWRRSARW